MFRPLSLIIRYEKDEKEGSQISWIVILVKEVPLSQLYLLHSYYCFKMNLSRLKNTM